MRSAKASRIWKKISRLSSRPTASRRKPPERFDRDPAIEGKVSVVEHDRRRRESAQKLQVGDHFRRPSQQVNLTSDCARAKIYCAAAPGIRARWLFGEADLFGYFGSRRTALACAKVRRMPVEDLFFGEILGP